MGCCCTVKDLCSGCLIHVATVASWCSWGTGKLPSTAHMLINRFGSLFRYVLFAKEISRHTSIQLVFCSPCQHPQLCGLTNWYMDFVEGFSKVGGKSVELIVVNWFSKYAHFIALGHPYSTMFVAKAFFGSIVQLHGFLCSIVSVCYIVFTSDFCMNYSTSSGPSCAWVVGGLRLSTRWFSCIFVV